MSEPEESSLHELTLKDDEVNLLKAKLEDKENDLEVFRLENVGLKNQLNEKLTGKEQKQSVQLNEKLEVAENAKEELETEMQKLQVITEQWRKAADTAASVLAGDVGMNGRRISKRCGSMDTHTGIVSKPVDLDSQVLIDDPDDVIGGGKGKGSGLRIGDLWKKKVFILARGVDFDHVVINMFKVLLPHSVKSYKSSSKDETIY
ncbi:interactor of constitutive active ROPs 4-like [Olea europaea var. sylvestris]|uniref:interactor of constitutive active ROPs 4-like n=1 Tax=Olea europaea var. sylvestris TaxID=158386 RepID=UPI000C1D6804|nr:interactor of constitutive active ROPs 4-like [Olea europaea var. sylvestris]